MGNQLQTGPTIDMDSDASLLHSEEVKISKYEPPGHENRHCVKCGFFRNCVSPFVSGVYYRDGGLIDGVPSHQPDGGWIVVVGDSVDEATDELGGPAFGGREALAVFKLARKSGVVDRIFYIPSFLCLPRNDSMEMEKLGKPHLKRCFQHFILPHIEALAPKAIIAMGGLATFHMIGRLDYYNLAGRAYRWGDREVPVYATWHYQHTALNPSKLKPEMVNMMMEIFEKISSGAVVATEQDIESDYVLGITPEVIRKWFEPVKSEAGRRRVLCWDVESNGLDIWSASYRVGVFSFAHSMQEKPLIVITDYPIAESIYYRECPDSKISWDDNKALCEDEVRIVLTDPLIPKIGHNLQFDENSVFSHYKWLVKGFYADTFLMNWSLNPDEVGFAGLENLCRKYLPDVPEYWRPLDRYREEKGGNLSYLEVPEDILLPYAAYDTVVTARIYKALRAELKQHDDDGTHGGYFIINNENDVVRETYSVLQYNIHVRAIHHRMCTHMERVGSAVDNELTDRVYQHYHKRKEELEAELRALPELQTFENDHLVNYVAKSSAQSKLIKKGELINISWGSGNQVRGFFIDFLKMPVLSLTGKKKPCLDEGVIQQYAYSPWHTTTDGKKKLTERGSHSAFPVYSCEPAKRLLVWRKTEKFITAFLDPIREGTIIHSDGMIHCKYKSAHVATGRLSACVDRDTLITTDKGLVPIHRLKIGDLVLTHKLRYKRCLDVFIKSYEEQFLVTTSNGNQIVCTAHHRFRTESGRWIALRDISSCDKVVTIGDCIVAIEESGQTRQENGTIVSRLLPVVSKSQHQPSHVQATRSPELCNTKLDSILWDRRRDNSETSSGDKSRDYDGQQIWIVEPQEKYSSRNDVGVESSASCQRRETTKRPESTAHAATGEGQEIQDSASGRLRPVLSGRVPIDCVVRSHEYTQKHAPELHILLQNNNGPSRKSQEASDVEDDSRQHGWETRKPENFDSESGLGDDAVVRNDYVGNCEQIKGQSLYHKAEPTSLWNRGQRRSSKVYKTGLGIALRAVKSWVNRVISQVCGKSQRLCGFFVHCTPEVDRTATCIQMGSSVFENQREAYIVLPEHSGSVDCYEASRESCETLSTTPSGTQRRKIQTGGFFHTTGSVDCGNRRDFSPPHSRGGRSGYESTNREWLPSAEVERGGCEKEFGAIYAVNITSIESVGVREVWDCTVDEDHSYFGSFLSSHNSKPPMQAIPREGLVKKLYCSRHAEGWIITRDYSGLEVRVLALFSRCPVLLHTFRTGGDVHFNTQRHFFKDAADKKNKTQRSICKQALFGNIYGQGDQGLYDLLTEGRVISPETGVAVTMDECHAFNQMIYEAYPAVERYVALTHRAGIREHWISSAFGFTRRLPEMANFDHYRNLQRLPKEDRDKMPTYRKLGGMIAQAKRRAQNCCDELTEALTREGWKRYNELTLQDELLTKNPQTDQFEWRKPSKICVFEQSATPVAVVETNAFSACVTPDHKWLVDKRVGRACKKEVGFVTMEELIRSRGKFALHRTGDYATADREITEFPPDDDRFLRFIGWYVTDSSIKTGHNRTSVVYVGQSLSKPDNCYTIRQLLNDWVVSELEEPSIDGGPGFLRWRVNTEVSSIVIKLLPDRKLTYDFIFSLNQRQAVILLNEMILGDGGQKLVGNHNPQTVVYCEDEHEASLIQALAMVAGIATNAHSRDLRKYGPRHSPKLKKPIMPTKPTWFVSLLNRKTAQILPHQVKWVDDKRLVWCPQVQNQNFVARRKGCAYITGNTGIQSTASDLTVLAACKIQQEYEKAGIEANVVNIIHDDIITDCRSHEYVEEAVKIKAWYMDNLPEWLPEFLPGYKADWIDCPIIGSLEVGLNPKDVLGIIEEPKLFGSPPGSLILNGGSEQSPVPLSWAKNYEQIREICYLKKNAINA